MVYNEIPAAARSQIQAVVRCIYCRMPAVCIPAVVVPVLNWHQDAYLLIREPGKDVVQGLCDTHKLSFCLEKFTDYYGSWYDMIRAHVESYRKQVPVKRMVAIPAKDPQAAALGFTDTVEEDTGLVQTVNAGYRVAERSECRLEYWRAERQRPRLLPLWRS